MKEAEDLKAVDKLSRIERLLQELVQDAESEKYDFLAYLLSIAHTEALNAVDARKRAGQ